MIGCQQQLATPTNHTHPIHQFTQVSRNYNLSESTTLSKMTLSHLATSSQLATPSRKTTKQINYTFTAGHIFNHS